MKAVICLSHKVHVLARPTHYLIFAVEELLSLVLPPKQSLDQDLDPCKSPAFLGDIVYPEANLTIVKVHKSIFSDTFILKYLFKAGG